MSVNEIIEQTSNDRTYVLDVLKKLEIYGLTEPIEFQKQHKQKKFKKLTELGLEISQLTFNIEKFNSKYLKLNQIIGGYKELDKIIDEYKKRNRIMKALKYKKEKIKHIHKTNLTIFRPNKAKDRNLDRFFKTKIERKGMDRYRNKLL